MDACIHKSRCMLVGQVTGTKLTDLRIGKLSSYPVIQLGIRLDANSSTCMRPSRQQYCREKVTLDRGKMAIISEFYRRDNSHAEF